MTATPLAVIEWCAVAALEPVEVRGRVVAPLTQKAVLLVVAAAGGRPVAYAAIGLVMQDLRLMAERGVGTGTEQYRGWSALPPAGGIQAAEWASAEEAAREIITLALDDGKRPSDFDVRTALLTPIVLDAWFRNAAKKCHPDVPGAGGSTEQMARLNRARDFIEKARAA